MVTLTAQKRAMASLQVHETEIAPQPDASIIWLHGLGADGYDFAPIVEEMRLPGAIRFVFPHAPQRPVTINGGYVMRAWYDVIARDLAAVQDENGIRSSAQLVEELIAVENSRGIAASRILLAGFSQGGAIALHTGLRHGEPLAGILALSTYLPLHQTLASERSAANSHTPVFMAHGDYDDVIPPVAGQASATLLQTLGQPVEFRKYPMPHSVCAEEIADIRAFIMARLALADT